MFFVLVVLCFDLEVSLRVFTNGANLRCLFANVDVAAVCALPDHVAISGEYQTAFNVFQQFAVTFFVMFFDLTYCFKQVSDAVEAFFSCFFRECSVHVCPFVVFTLCSVQQVFSCGRNSAVMEQFEPDFCVFFFVVCCFQEQSCDLFIAFFFALLA